MVYDIAAKRRILNIRAHNADGTWSWRPLLYRTRRLTRAGLTVNGVCFADENSTNVIVSASDDGYLKVW